MKQLLENWRKYLNEELAATAPRKGRGIKRGAAEPMPIDQLLPVFFKVMLDDPETFDLVPKEAAGKSFEEIKGRAFFADFVDDIKNEIESLLAGFSLLPIIKDYLKDGYDRKAFLRFVQELPDEKKEAVLKAIGAMSDKFSTGSVGLMSMAPNEIKLYACLFRSGVDPANILEDEYAKCRRETMVRIEEKLDK
tara:strand:+ start:316 stop:894 length:579 start_codon:yes stop_codon:yes gene_type:complete